MAVQIPQADPHNANMYIGNLAPDVGDAELQAAVAAFGRVLDVKVYRKGGYAFAQFASHEEAVAAIVGLSGQNLGGKTLKCSWGRCAHALILARSPSRAWTLARRSLSRKDSHRAIGLCPKIGKSATSLPLRAALHARAYCCMSLCSCCGQVDSHATQLV